MSLKTKSSFHKKSTVASISSEHTTKTHSGNKDKESSLQHNSTKLHSSNSSSKEATTKNPQNNAVSSNSAVQDNPKSSSTTHQSRLFTEVKPTLSPILLDIILHQFKFEYCTPVQSVCIPLLLSNKDVSVQACTGSGKTLAYVIPMLQLLLKLKTQNNTTQLNKFAVYAIIISPTRELALQIESVIQIFLDTNPTELNFSLLTLIGGNQLKDQEKKYLTEGGNILVSTPGRLEAILNNKSNSGVNDNTSVKNIKLDTRSLELLILDEADRLLDLGFQAQLNSILNKLPKQRRTGLFSATQTNEIKELARAGLRNPVQINVQVQFKPKNSNLGNTKQKSINSADIQDEFVSRLTPTSLSNYYILTNYKDKLVDLLQFLIAHPNEKIIVFFLTCAQVDYFTALFERLELLHNETNNNVTNHDNNNKKKKTQGASVKRQVNNNNNHNLPPVNITVIGLHGQQNQNKRNLHYKQFVSSTQGVLFTTDLTARGIDIPDVNYCIQFDPPTNADFYVHRIGRVGRAGRIGTAITFLDRNTTEDTFINYLKRKNIPIEEFKEEKQPITNINSLSNSSSILSEIHSHHLKDRSIMELGQRAYVSFIRAYKEHQLNLIFQFHILPFADCCTGYGLLFLPKLPDLKHFNINFTPPFPNLKASQISFQSEPRETERLKQNEIKAEKRKLEQLERETLQAEKKKLKEQKGPKRRKKAINKEKIAEWEQLQTENRLIKKYKQGKITKKQLDQALMGMKDSDTEQENEENSDAESNDSNSGSSDDDDNDDQSDESMEEEIEAGVDESNGMSDSN